MRVPRYRLAKRVLIAVAVIASSLVVPVSPGAGAPMSSTFVGESCTEAMAFFLREQSMLRPFVPERFTLAEVAPGIGEVLVMVTKCDNGIVNGKKVGPTLFSEVGLYIESPEEAEKLPGGAAPGFPYYQPWHLTDEPSLRRVLSRLGIRDGAPKELSLETPSAAQVEGDVAWKGGDYGLTVLQGNPAGLFASRPSTFWHVVKDGLVATAYADGGTTLSAGLAVVEAAPDGRLADILGGATAVAAEGVVATYERLAARSMFVRD